VEDEMSYRTFRIIQAFIGMALGAIVGGFTASGNWIIPLVGIMASLIIMMFLRRRIREVVVDERTRIIAGKAASLTITSGTMIMAVSGIIMYIVGRDSAQGLQWGGLTLLYAACGLMVINALANVYYKEKYSGQE
jgi:uncharacterized membrane protein